MTNLELIQQHSNDTKFCSFREHMIKCSTTYNQILSKGKDIVPDLIQYLKREDAGMNIIMLLEEITGQKPYSPKEVYYGMIAYSVQECKNKWINFAENELIYTREELIQLCLDVFVPYEKWNNRDSYCAQLTVQSIYQGLMSGLTFHIGEESDNHTIWIYFEKPNEEQLSKINTFFLNIDSRDEYFEWYRKENGDEYVPEMFDGEGIDWRSSYFGGYLPARERLNEVNGEDWY